MLGRCEALNESEPGAPTWEYRVPLVGNLFLLRDCLFAIVLSLLGMQVLVLVVGFFAGEGLVVLPGADVARFEDFGIGYQDYSYKHYTLRVRAVRAF